MTIIFGLEGDFISVQNRRLGIKFVLCTDKIGSKFMQIYESFVKFKKSKNM
ncbi:hypothetical protein [Campylobacter showae]|uniref:hypothetical protein n=1 Tax=Campylobacter showae TaxID=204 RepID=UPI0013D2F40A|nr:hypothetical protein [Campylobacter showae]